ncbi:hypothetical protein [Candidatus Collinsella stercoripullorum]|uniref:anti-sigma-I factor RsgI family protein n=1 Tax=Candidatus Collinsella stercoripullorum TaxID=2838522 RepID=UPI0022DEFE6B|nr:hypothetical protein [Candidatus Collinsella stercoripullorum]
MTDDLERRMREAFDGAHLPAGLAERTLARIEAERAAQAEPASQAERAVRMEHMARAERATPAMQVERAAQAEPAMRAGRAARAEHPARTERRPARPLTRRAAIALAACLVLAAVGVGGYAWAQAPCAYVAIDVNPSIELGINRLGNVASVRAYNEDGERLLQALDLDGLAYADAMAALEERLRGYLADGATVEMTVVCDDERQAAELEQVGVGCLSASGSGSVHCSHASSEEHHAAESAGMGLGKYRLYLELVDAGVDISPEEASAMTMRELRALLEDAGSASAGGSGSDAGQTSGRAGGHGNGSRDEHGREGGHGGGHGGD